MPKKQDPDPKVNGRSSTEKLADDLSSLVGREDENEEDEEKEEDEP